MEVVTPFLEGRDMIVEAGGDVFRLCYQCGTCTATCPWNRVRSLNVRQAMHEAALGVLDIEAEENWLCVTCNACVDRCPRGVDIVGFWRSLRYILIENQMAPADLRRALSSISTDGNPFIGERSLRSEWAQSANIKRFDKTTDFLLFPCCATIYDPKTKVMADALVAVLRAAEVDFGVLTDSEVCCGESARKAGSEELFQSVAEQNIELFKKEGVKKIITISPHCYWTFKNEYPQFGGDFEVVHYTELLLELVRNGRLKPKKRGDGKVAFHDPCYLGRHSGIYEAPRQLLQEAGYELVVMPEEREDALCCGGGGGRIWMETKKGERFSDIRVNQAADAGASVLAVACPYCYMNIADSIITEGKEDTLRCADIAELLKEIL